MDEVKSPQTKFESSDKLAKLANEAVGGFREDNPEAFKELVNAYEGKSADVVLFGHGRFHVTVSKGNGCCRA